MTLRSGVAALVFFTFIAFVAPLAMAAPTPIRGVVVSSPGPGLELVRHAAFAGMPPMTMLFRVAAGTSLAPGDEVSGVVDPRSEPWSLSEVRVLAHRSVPTAPAASVDVGARVPDPPLVEQGGLPFRLASLRGARYALSFIYTRCSDARMCPLVSAKFAAVQRDRRAASAHLVEVTLDPQYDRAPVLGRYGRLFGADRRRWHLLTGAPAGVLAFAAGFGVQAYPDAGGILHTERTLVVGPDGRVERFLDGGNWTPEELAGLLAREPGFWERVAVAPSGALRWCGDHLGAGGRTAVHHAAVFFLPIVFLAALIATVHFCGTRRSAMQRR